MAAKAIGHLQSPEPGTVGVARRVGWLLRMNRVLGREERWAKAKQFCASFRGGCWPGTVDESKVSRWETTMVRPPYLAVRRYEEMLELDGHSLVAVIDTLNRYTAPPTGGPPALDRGFHRDRDRSISRAEELMDKLTSSEIATAADWDELTAILSEIPEITPIPRSAWANLGGRLMSETVIANGIPWMLRFESLNRLLGHPSGQRAAIDICASLASDSTSQVIIEPISALDGINHPDANHHVLAQLNTPTSDAAFYGALLACNRKARHGHFTIPEARRILRAADDLLAGPDRPDDGQVVAAQVLYQLPAQFQHELSSSARRGLSTDPVLNQLVTTGRLSRTTSPVLVDRVLARVLRQLPREPQGFRDDILPILVDELLFHPLFDTRLNTALLIEASPYRAPVAVALADELRNASVLRDISLLRPILGALRIVGSAVHRAIPERLILAPGLSTASAVSATHAIAHMPGRSEDSFWAQALAFWGSAWQRDHDPGSAAVLSNLVYALGMAGNEELLAVIRDTHSLPSRVRATAGWWFNVPDHIRRSARN